MNTQEVTPLEPLCSIDEIAQACFVSVQTVRNWEARGILPPAIRIGRRCLRWRAADIEAWLAANQSKPHQTAKESV